MNETIFVGTGSPFGGEEIVNNDAAITKIAVRADSVMQGECNIVDGPIAGPVASSRCTATSLMRYLDANRPEGKMCLSNMECQQIDDAWDNDDWETIIKYIDKYRKP